MLGFLADQGFSPQKSNSAWYESWTHKRKSTAEEIVRRIGTSSSNDHCAHLAGRSESRRAAQKTILLLQKGIVLSGNPGEGLIYKFTGLNSIKPDMITEATRNARAAADRFASDSGSKVGSIRQANQGAFSILPEDQASDGGDGGYGSADSSVMKTVRVVTSVDYYLEK